MSCDVTKLNSGLSIVVPVYNSEGTLPDLIRRLDPVLRASAESFEVILINDGSRDQSWQVIKRLAQLHPWIRGLDLMRNYGQHNALLCGIRSARYDRVVTLDDDLQNPPEEIAKLLAKLRDGYDVVYGTPNIQRHGLWRDVASHLTKLTLQKAMGAETARRISAFRVLRTHLREAFRDFNSPFISVDVLLTWGTTRFTAVSVRHEPRRIGTSNYTFRKLLIHALNMVTGFSTWPLHLATLVGLGFTLFGIGVFLYILLRYSFMGNPVPGFPFLGSVIAIFSGAQLFSLGIIGEYLARVHLRMMDRPPYAVRTIIHPGAGAANVSGANNIEDSTA